MGYYEIRKRVAQETRIWLNGVTGGEPDEPFREFVTRISLKYGVGASCIRKIALENWDLQITVNGKVKAVGGVDYGA